MLTPRRSQVRSRFIPTDFQGLNVGSIRVLRVTRIYNRFMRSQFDVRDAFCPLGALPSAALTVCVRTR